MTGFRAWLRSLFINKEERRYDAALPDTSTPLNGLRSFTQDHNAAALALYGQLRQNPDNLFFSPFSIRTALGMAFAGARGETARQISIALHFTPLGENLHVAFAELIQSFNMAGDSQVLVTAANALWSQEGAPLRAEFRDLITPHYGGAINLIDFRDNPEGARVTINTWVEEKTNQKIQKLIPPGSLNADTNLLLVNAVYFKGMWLLQFRKAATRDEPFYLEDGGSVKVPLMHQHNRVRYWKARGFQVVDLDYQGGDLSMLVLLPGKKDGLQDLEKRISVRMLHECVAKLREHELKLYLPRFRMTWGSVDLRRYLSALGMPLAFERSQADFSGINGLTPPHQDCFPRPFWSTRLDRVLMVCRRVHSADRLALRRTSGR